MQLGRKRLSTEERSRKFREGLCLYCSQAGHRLATCSSRIRAAVNETVRVSQTLCNKFLLRPSITVFFVVSGSPVKQAVLVDSGADACFMDSNLAKALELKSILKVHSITRPCQGSDRFFPVGSDTSNLTCNYAHWKRA